MSSGLEDSLQWSKVRTIIPSEEDVDRQNICHEGDQEEYDRGEMKGGSGDDGEEDPRNLRSPVPNQTPCCFQVSRVPAHGTHILSWRRDILPPKS